MRLLQLVIIVLALPLASTIALCDSHSMSLEDVVKMLKKQQAQIEVLQAELAEAKARTADEGGVATINTPQSPGAVGAQRSRWAPIGGKTLGKAAAWAERTSIGGYGELHANRLNGENGASDLDQTDFHRLVLFVGHEFNDWVRFASEIEIEHSHAGGGPGDRLGAMGEDLGDGRYRVREAGAERFLAQHAETRHATLRATSAGTCSCAKKNRT